MKVNLKEWMAKISQTTLIGEIKGYAGSDEPEGWMKCDGSAVSRTKYRRLFEVIGTTFGSGDGSTTFNLPDMRGRSPLGAGATQDNNQPYWGTDVTNIIGERANFILGETGGETKHTLTVNQLATHSHSFHGWVFNGISRPGLGPHYGIGYLGDTGSGSVFNSPLNDNMQVPWGGDNTGGSQAHNNLSPYSVINFIIYVGGGTT